MVKNCTKLVVVAAVCLPHITFADVGVFGGSGHNLRQVKTEKVQLVTIAVRIKLARGTSPVEGSAGAMDEAQYSCVFELKNLTATPAEVQVGFPIDRPLPQAMDADDLMQKYGFLARDESTAYEVDLVRSNPLMNSNSRSDLFVWKMRFGASQTRSLRVEYHIPLSMSFATTRMDERTHAAPNGSDPVRLLDTAFWEGTSYVTSTGSSWAGKVERATFTALTDRFEQYLSGRGWSENRNGSKPFLPEYGVWWFKDLSPAGSQKVAGGIEWQFTDFKPQEPIKVGYYLTQLPGSAADVPAFIEHLRRTSGDSEDLRAKLVSARDIVLATYGKEPDDATAKGFAAAQRWYAPRKNFSMSDLNDDQRAVIAKLDEIIAQEK